MAAANSTSQVRMHPYLAIHSYGFGTGGSALILASAVGADLCFVLAVRYKGWFSSGFDYEPMPDTIQFDAV